MKFRFPLAMMLAALIFTFVVAPVSAQVADGTYQVNYEMKEASSDNTSIADGYFTKPATLTVKNGVQTITLTVTGTNYIQSLSAPSGPVSVISEDTANNTASVSFRVDGDLSQPLTMNMHIIVPDMYDQSHTARAVFDTSGLAQASSEGGTDNSGEATTATAEKVDNPKTGENSPVALYASLMLASVIALFAIWKFRPVRN